MADPEFDIERIREVLRRATAEGADFSQRSLAKEAGEGRDAVGDIVNGRNKNPTIKVLANLARALGGDLSMFGLAEERTDPLTEDELQIAILEALPNMPSRGPLDKRARFLAANVAQILRLPSNLQPIRSRGELSATGATAPPRAPTN